MNNRIKQLRLEKGITQEELAEQLKISKWYLNQIENNKREASFVLKYKIAHYFDLKLNDIFLNDEGQKDL